MTILDYLVKNLEFVPGDEVEEDREDSINVLDECLIDEY